MRIYESLTTLIGTEQKGKLHAYLIFLKSTHFSDNLTSIQVDQIINS